MSKKAISTIRTTEAKRVNPVSRTRKTDRSQQGNPLADQIMFLQRTIGNQAVQRLIKSGRLQAKLTINPPGDIYEQETDRVSKQVVIQRQEQEDEEYLQMMPIMRRQQSSEGWTAEPDLEASIHSMRGGGHSLPENIRMPMEGAFGADLSQAHFFSGRTGSG